VRFERIDLPEPVTTETCAIHSVPADWSGPWDDLAAAAAEPNVFAERWFVEAGIRHLGPDETTRLVAIWSGGGDDRALIGLIPLQIETGYARIPVRHVQNWRHAHAFLGTPLVRAGHEREFWAVLLALLDGADWAPGFLHLTAIGEDGPIHRGLAAAAKRIGRRCDIVHRRRRALLAAGPSAATYYEAAVRKKKRKEIARLRARLSEQGALGFETLERAGEVDAWASDYLALEAAGWKGRGGSALAARSDSAAFFRAVFSAAFEEGRLEAIRLSLDDKPIAMLVNLHAPPGAFSFKIAFDEAYARFSPGVLIEIENLRALDRPGFAWMDSCAMDNHPMIDSLWRERRSIVRLTVPLAGARRRALFTLCRLLEDSSALVRRIKDVPHV
jgi:CelD/BcsL family acetyltransferase involved in cellulose biosynthesis